MEVLILVELSLSCSLGGGWITEARRILELIILFLLENGGEAEALEDIELCGELEVELLFELGFKCHP